MTKEEKTNPDLPNKSLLSLGKVVANFAILEVEIDYSIWLLLLKNQPKSEKTGQIVTAELSVKNKIALLSSLYQYRFPEKKPFKNLKDILKKIEDANKIRNKLVHSVWRSAGHNAMRISVSAKQKNGLKFEFEVINHTKIDGMANSILKIAYDTQKFYLKFV